LYLFFCFTLLRSDFFSFPSIFIERKESKAFEGNFLDFAIGRTLKTADIFSLPALIGLWPIAITLKMQLLLANAFPTFFYAANIMNICSKTNQKALE